MPPSVAGPATIRVRAARPVFFGLRERRPKSSPATSTVRLEPPRVAVVSLHHFINRGGAEFVVLRVTPTDVESGSASATRRYPATGQCRRGLTDPALRVGFFAMRWDQDLNTP